jgi:dihydrofolate reductase
MTGVPEGAQDQEGGLMRKLIVSEFVTLDGVIQAPGGKDEDRDGGFEHGGWTLPYWHDDIGASFLSLMKDVDALLLGRRTYVVHAEAFEPMPPGNPFGDVMNAPKKYVVSKTLEQPKWRRTTIIREDVIESVRALKAQPGKSIVTDSRYARVAPAPLSGPWRCVRSHRARPVGGFRLPQRRTAAGGAIQCNQRLSNVM